MDLDASFHFGGRDHPVHQRIHTSISLEGITPAGMTAVKEFLAGNQLPDLPDNWMWEWVVQKGEYSGTFPRRYARYAYKIHSLNVDSRYLELLGNVYNSHASKVAEYFFDFDRTCDWAAGTFGDEGSCFWGGRNDARSIIRDNGGGAVRFFTTAKGSKGIARAWIAPGFPNPEDLILFNAYGTMQTRDIARVLATWLGLEYQGIPLTVMGNTQGTLWINGVRENGLGSNADYRGGLVVATSERVREYQELYGKPPQIKRPFDLPWKKVPVKFYCGVCHKKVGEEGEGLERGTREIDGSFLCGTCYPTHACTCENCGGETMLTQITEHEDGLKICRNCNTHYHACFYCKRELHESELRQTEHERRWLCLDHLQEHYVYCLNCGRFVSRKERTCEICKAHLTR